MSTPLDVISDAVRDQNLVLAKAVPRSVDHLVLELRRSDGSTVAGQWLADEGEAATAYDQTRRAGTPTGVRLLGRSGVLLQPGGADRKLRALRRLTADPTAELVAHRPEQRGVVRRDSGHSPPTYTKVVRAKRLTRLVGGARLTVPGVSLPQVLSVDEKQGSVTFAELPGRTLFAVLGDLRTPDAEVEQMGYAVGRALARLHESPPPPYLISHDARDEVLATARWVELAAGYGLLASLPADPRALLEAARRRLGSRGGRPVLLHRDLHDKQLLVHGSGVGMLDFDLAARGEPALDLANLLVHLQLRALQGRCTTELASTCAAAVRDGYRPTAAVRERTAAYQLTARIRLACVYAFRPAHTPAGAALLDTCPSGPVHSLEEDLS